VLLNPSGGSSVRPLFAYSARTLSNTADESVLTG
jgi:hypothetical protein